MGERRKKKNIMKEFKYPYKYPYTKFGEFLVALQERTGETMRQMADKLNVSSQFLSNVAHGRKGVPDDWVPRLIHLYHLPEDAEIDIRLRIEESQTFYAVSTKHASPLKRKAAACFTKNFAAMDDETAKKISALLAG